jgi:hypothetical protein
MIMINSSYLLKRISGSADLYLLFPFLAYNLIKINQADLLIQKFREKKLPVMFQILWFPVLLLHQHVINMIHI